MFARMVDSHNLKDCLQGPWLCFRLEEKIMPLVPVVQLYVFATSTFVRTVCRLSMCDTSCGNISSSPSSAHGTRMSLVVETQSTTCSHGDQRTCSPGYPCAEQTGPYSLVCIACEVSSHAGEACKQLVVVGCRLRLCTATNSLLIPACTHAVIPLTWREVSTHASQQVALAVSCHSDSVVSKREGVCLNVRH
jgi:hypothetical protein